MRLGKPMNKFRDLLEKHWWVQPLVCLLVCALLLVIAGNAKADNVYVCTKSGSVAYQDCGDANTKIVNVVQPTDLVATTTGTGAYCFGPASFWYCSTFAWKQSKDLADTTQVGMCGGTETTLSKCAAGNGGASAVELKKDIQGIDWILNFTGYECYPKSWDEIRKRKTTTAAVLLWYCNEPTAIYPQWFSGNPANIPDNILGLSWSALISAFKPSRVSTADEIALVEKLNIDEGVKITVAAISTGTRPVYAATATNTKGNDTGKRVGVGTPCGWKRLQDSYGKATNYFLVDGGYALCTVVGITSK
jgi:hypothetical protein